METSDKVFAGSIPEIYDRLLVPLIFEPYALHAAQQIAQTNARNILELAAGTGVLTRAMALRLPKDTHITATDLNQPMLDHAKSKQPGEKPAATKHAADALARRFGNSAVDGRIRAFVVTAH
jgi:ubiquinone/menaquinone biosynthesis C-methylase UbiE